MAAIPYMPLFVADYMADAGHLSTTEHGAYLLLIMSYWQRGGAFRAPDEQALNVRLANVARMSNAEWLRAFPVLSEFFQVALEDGVTWSHKRIERELSKFRAKSLQAQEAGLASAQRRANGRSTGVEHPFNHTDTDTNTDKNKHKNIAPKAGAVDEWFDSEFWPIWVKAANDSMGGAKKAARIKVRDAKTQALIIEGARRQRLTRLGQDPKYRSHAATWINQGRWIDGVDDVEEAQEVHRPLPPPKFWVDDLMDPK
jgi:uncharacterized protein YdaU (DUF1376 family)